MTKLGILEPVMKKQQTKHLCRPGQFHPSLWPIFTWLKQPLLLLLSLFAVRLEVSLAAPALDETRTEYALKITAPIIDGEINVQDPDEWRFAAGNSDYWRVFPDNA